MGDRANVKVIEGESTVYLYTHWTGTNLPGVLQAALKHAGQDQSRWNDGAYLARIIFCAMISCEASQSKTGFGISSVVGDGEDRILTVDVDNQTVSDGNDSYSFNEYAHENPDNEPRSWGKR